jgi:CheY-like chemotaxis protein
LFPPSLQLPGISGIEATEQIRALERASIGDGGGNNDVVFIFGLTGNVDPESMRNYEAAGMNGCILKGKVLADAVKVAIEEANQGKFVNIS